MQSYLPQAARQCLTSCSGCTLGGLCLNCSPHRVPCCRTRPQVHWILLALLLRWFSAAEIRSSQEVAWSTKEQYNYLIVSISV